jgi:acyl carrier protein
MTPPQHQDVLEIFRAEAKHLTDREFEDIDAGTTIIELGIDSMSLAAIVTRIEDELAIRFENADLVGIKTVGELSSLAARLVAAKSP